MIEGAATQEGTRQYLESHGVEGFKIGAVRGGKGLGDGVWCAPVGFGGYRITREVASHGDALRLALRSGVNLVDTSANYADGGSESLVGAVLEAMITDQEITRSQVIVVSKAGYIQGRNEEIRKQRQAQGRPFEEIVRLGDDLAHCMHPGFLADQLDRSLERLGVKTIDFYLLHNPEYYLEWAANEGVALEAARNVYYQRIRNAFDHLESEVKKGRIRCYGVSSNTFGGKRDDAAFTDLERVWEAASAVGPEHHFRVIQLPLNLLEPGAVIENNQADGGSVLSAAFEKGIGVLVNRPLNAFGKNQLFRLADIDEPARMPEEEIIRHVRAVGKSETRLWRVLLPKLLLPAGIVARIKQQLAVGDVLAHYRLNFGSYERWRQVKSGNFMPRIQGVMDFLKAHAGGNPEITAWMASHEKVLQTAFTAVGSMYADEARMRIGRIRQALSHADPEWAAFDAKAPFSLRAIRAVRSTRGVCCVLVGMRRQAYVQEVVEEMKCPVNQAERSSGWMRLAGSLGEP